MNFALGLPRHQSTGPCSLNVLKLLTFVGLINGAQSQLQGRCGDLIMWLAGTAPHKVRVVSC
jgi:hypothetical protein